MCRCADSLQTLKNQLKHVPMCRRAMHHKDQKDIEKESGQYSTLIPIPCPLITAVPVNRTVNTICKEKQTSLANVPKCNMACCPVHRFTPRQCIAFSYVLSQKYPTSLRAASFEAVSVHLAPFSFVGNLALCGDFS